MSNRYMDEALTRRRVAEHGHRAVVGGLWDQIGPLQRDFLIDQGLRPQDRVLDIGCGAMRGGAPLAAWLEPEHYYGIDISESLIETGWRAEIETAGLADHLPRDHLHITEDFEVPFDGLFDVGLAVSLFTHLPLSGFTHCLERVAPHFRTEGRIFATVFEGEGADLARSEGIVTHDDRDPFHFTREALTEATPEAWTFDWIGDWNHPRGQQMVRLTRRQAVSARTRRR